MGLRIMAPYFQCRESAFREEPGPPYRANEVAPARRRDSASTVAAKARTAPVIASVMPAERPRRPSPFVIIEISKAPTAA
jgi:hypothetical protein